MRILVYMQMAYFIGAIHTGANLHGGNPTIFGQWEPKPVLGWIIGLSWLLVVPWLHEIGKAITRARIRRHIEHHGYPFE